MPRIVVVTRCSECPWNVWDYRESLFRCSEPTIAVAYLQNQDKLSPPPAWCPLVEAKVLLKIKESAVAG